MSEDVLQRIQALQFSDRAAAEALLLEFIRGHFPLDVVGVELRPLAVSLNSFNGFLSLADGERLFFKTHTEQDNVIDEYYHAALLAEAGYPVLQPLHTSTAAGRQLLIYEVIEDPSVFDLAWAVEQGESQALAALTQAQHNADDELLMRYQQTLAVQSADDAAHAPIHQLFYHRLTGGRLARFYHPSIQIALPGGDAAMGAARRVRWLINGQHYEQTLDDLITRAVDLLNPAQAGPAITGHGDAHNGNVFFRAAESLAGGPARLLYFDPAFAGRHHPLLDVTKPLFHNVFAMWMYFPTEKAAATNITLVRRPDVWVVEHDYGLHPVREMFLGSKLERVLTPVLRDLRARGWLQPDWRLYLKAALFCCPFLTMNLADRDKFPPSISLLGLAMTVEMGSESLGVRSRIDAALDSVEAALD
ncbi:MAG: hypothetical protein GYB67_03455 [Chloroflexi bacterium]|nr:hypothetical protein [Chloroflexota bacterium]